RRRRQRRCSGVSPTPVARSGSMPTRIGFVAGWTIVTHARALVRACIELILRVDIHVLLKKRDLKLKSLFKKMREFIRPGLFLRRFFGPVPEAIKNHLNTAELLRISITAVVAGGGTLGMLQAILTGVGTIFPAPNDAAAATFVLTLLLESLRRLDH